MASSHNSNFNVKKSFNSSKMLESIRSNNEDYINSNNSAQIPNSNEPNNLRDGYEAPVVLNLDKKNNDDKYLTNNGENNKERKKFHLLENPY